MGCVTSKEDVNDLHPNIFQVTNVDGNGQLVSPGQLELTDVDLVLYQRGKAPMRWPLCYLRKYGFDSEMFTFECGRRCPNGAGIYAFRCKKAEQLFNMLQHNIQVGNLSEEQRTLPNEYPMPLATNGPPVQRRVLPGSQLQSSPSAMPPVEGYLNPAATGNHTMPTTLRSHHHRPDSITSSNGPASPSTPLNSPPIINPAAMIDFPIEHNNNKRSMSIAEHHPYTNSNIIEEHMNIGASAPATYMNFTASTPTATTNDNSSYINVTPSGQQPQQADLANNANHLYMNVHPEHINVQASLSPLQDSLALSAAGLHDDQRQHCYANISRHDIEALRPCLSVTASLDQSSMSTSNPNTPTVRDMNYVELDLVPSSTATIAAASAAVSTGGGTLAPSGSHSHSADSPSIVASTKKSYVTIDFNKTNALSQAANQQQSGVEDEGSRKTRHNSTIGELTIARQSSSLSD